MWLELKFLVLKSRGVAEAIVFSTRTSQGKRERVDMHCDQDGEHNAWSTTWWSFNDKGYVAFSRSHWRSHSVQIHPYSQNKAVVSFVREINQTRRRWNSWVDVGVWADSTSASDGIVSWSYKVSTKDQTTYNFTIKETWTEIGTWTLLFGYGDYGSHTPLAYPVNNIHTCETIFANQHSLVRLIPESILAIIDPGAQNWNTFRTVQFSSRPTRSTIVAVLMIADVL